MLMKTLPTIVLSLTLAACSPLVSQPMGHADESSEQALKKELAETKVSLAQSVINQGNAEAMMGQLRSANGQIWLEKFQAEKAALEKETKKEEPEKDKK